MKNEAYSALLEPLLAKYYLLCSVCNAYMSDEEDRRIFSLLSSVFCVSENSLTDTYYMESQKEHFKVISDFRSYERFCRTAEFAKNSGQNIEMTEFDRVILAQKREAMIISDSLFRACKHLTKENINEILLLFSNNGSVDAMSMHAFMEYHGICMKKDSESAKKTIRRCAGWNDLFANLMGLSYDKENSERYFNRLFTVMNTTSKREAFEHIRECFGYSGALTEDRVAKIINKAFGMGIVRRELYDRAFSKVAHSSVISAEDKEKLLLTKQKDALPALSDLPFDIKKKGNILCDEKCTDLPVIKREWEMTKIMQNLAVSAACPREVYRPLLIISSDEYVSEMYSEMIKKGIGDVRSVTISAGTMSGGDLAHSRENFILRGLCETKDANTVFFIKDCEELDDANLEDMCRLLESEYRKKYRLSAPPVSMDLSTVGFVLFANEQNPAVTALSHFCDTVRTAKINQSEKKTVIASIFEQKKEAFAHRDVQMSDGCVEYLCSYDVKQSDRIIDEALRYAIYKKMVLIDAECLRGICKDRNINVLKRGFGYTGGEVFA